MVKQVWEIHSLYLLRDIQCTLALNSLGSPSIKKLHSLITQPSNSETYLTRVLLFFSISIINNIISQN